MRGNSDYRDGQRYLYEQITEPSTEWTPAVQAGVFLLGLPTTLLRHGMKEVAPKRRT